MFKINTPDGEKYLVQLVGAKSYRIGDLRVTRGGTLTVSKRTRDYLVLKTKGQFVDYDPTPAEPVQEVFAPQFGLPPVSQFDPADFNPRTNPPLSQSEAALLAAHSASEGAVVDPLAVAGTMAAQDAKAALEAAGGDLTGADVPKTGGGKSGAKKGGITIKGGAAPTTGPVMAANPTTADNATLVE